MSYIYLASPYSDPDKAIMEERAEQAGRCTAYMLRTGQFVYSPIVHCHELAKKFELPSDIEYWRRYNKAMLRSAYELCVLKLVGWDVSVGVLFEMGLADDLEITTRFIILNQYMI